MRVSAVFFSGFRALQFPAGVILALVLCLVAQSAKGAPFPAASGLLTQGDSGLFWKSRGFSLVADASNWKIVGSEDIDGPVEKAIRTPLKELTYLHRRFPDARLHVSVEALKAPTNLKAFSRRWVREYHHYGLELLRSRPFQLNGASGVLYDLASSSQRARLRQAVFLRGKTAVTVTCADKADHFADFAPDCEQVMKKFRWIQ